MMAINCCTFGIAAERLSAVFAETGKLFCGKRFAAWDAATRCSYRAKVALNIFEDVCLKFSLFADLLHLPRFLFCSLLSELILRSKLLWNEKHKQNFKFGREPLRSALNISQETLSLASANIVELYEFTCLRTANLEQLSSSHYDSYLRKTFPNSCLGLIATCWLSVMTCEIFESEK